MPLASLKTTTTHSTLRRDQRWNSTIRTHRPISKRPIFAAPDSNKSSNDLSSSGMSEELIERLRAAEEEAARLKKQLAEMQTVDSPGSSSSITEKTPRPQAVSRIDGGDFRRETLAFVESKPRNWLSESDVEFFTGGGPSETEDASSLTSESQEEASSIVQRRLLLGLGLTAAVIGFAVIPTEKLQPPPSKPLFFYIVPLLRVKELLGEIEHAVPDGDYEKLRQLLSFVEGPPNNVQDNLRAAAASLEDSKAASAADAVARDVYEYIKGIDYQTYFESVGGSPGSRGGAAQKELFEYSLKSTAAAIRKLNEFLSLLPRDQVEAAQQQRLGRLFEL